MADAPAKSDAKKEGGMAKIIPYALTAALIFIIYHVVLSELCRHKWYCAPATANSNSFADTGNESNRREGVRPNVAPNRNFSNQGRGSGPVWIQQPQPSGGYRCEINKTPGWCVD